MDILFFAINIASAQTITLSVSPATILQGDPFKVVLDGSVGISSVKKLSFDGKKISVFLYQKKHGAFYVILHRNVGLKMMSLV